MQGCGHNVPTPLRTNRDHLKVVVDLLTVVTKCLVLFSIEERVDDREDQ